VKGLTHDREKGEDGAPPLHRLPWRAAYRATGNLRCPTAGPSRVLGLSLVGEERFVTQVKICGITNWADACCAAEAGADLLGFILYPPSPRYVAPDVAGCIVRALHAAYGARAPRCVGVFVSESVARVRAVLDETGLDLAQLHGDESLETLQALAPRAYKAIRPATVAEALDQARRYVAPETAPDGPQLLVDAYHPERYGGTGLPVDLAVARAALGSAGRQQRILLAGGLALETVGQVVAVLHPWGVDVSSGVEREKGRKDHARVRAFVAAVREAEREMVK
jgi:phosphoribosylanthranilate isomerase